MNVPPYGRTLEQLQISGLNIYLSFLEMRFQFKMGIFRI